MLLSAIDTWNIAAHWAAAIGLPERHAPAASSRSPAWSGSPPEVVLAAVEPLHSEAA